MTWHRSPGFDRVGMDGAVGKLRAWVCIETGEINWYAPGSCGPNENREQERKVRREAKKQGDLEGAAIRVPDQLEVDRVCIHDDQGVHIWLCPRHAGEPPGCADDVKTTAQGLAAEGIIEERYRGFWIMGGPRFAGWYYVVGIMDYQRYTLAEARKRVDYYLLRNQQ